MHNAAYQNMIYNFCPNNEIWFRHLARLMGKRTETDNNDSNCLLGLSMMWFHYLNLLFNMKLNIFFHFQQNTTAAVLFA